jgi:hypothetical protein
MNRYFVNTLDLLPGSKARASEVEANLSAVELGFNTVQTEVDLKAPAANAALTGTAVITNQETSGTATFAAVTINGSLDMNAGSAGTITGLSAPVGSTDAATKGYVDTAINNLVTGAPGVLDTLDEIAAALGDDPNFAATMTAQLALKLDKSGGTMSGVLDMGSQKITGLATATASSDAISKGYVDALYGSTAAASASAAAAAISETNAAASAATATTQAGTATTKASEAVTSAGTASTQAGIATTKAAEAAASAASIAGGPVASVNGLTGVVTGLAPVASPTFTGTVSGITSAMVGLGNVDNTSDATKNSAVATLTNKTLTSPALTTPTITGYTETVYSLTGTDINPANGTVQTKTLSANTTFTESLADGQSVTLGITAGAYTVTWPTTTWSKVGGSGVAPTLTSTGVNWVVLWQVGGVLRGAFLGTA